VTVANALLSPGVLIANASNPATGFVFDTVTFTNVSHWPVDSGNYFCESVQGVAVDSDPVPPCFESLSREEFERRQRAQ